MSSIKYLPLILLASCTSLVPTEKKEVSATKTTEAVVATQQTEATKRIVTMPSVTFGNLGTNNTVSLTIPEANMDVRENSSAGQDINTKDYSSFMNSISIPLGVKLILIAIGIGLIFLLIWVARRSSVAVDTAFRAGDKMSASVITQIDHMISTTSDPTQKAGLLSLKVAAEKERGKFNASA